MLYLLVQLFTKRWTIGKMCIRDRYGMSDRVGMIQYGSDEDEVFIGRDLAHTKSYGSEIADVIDEEVKRIVDECYSKAKKIILEHEDAVSYTHLLEIFKLGAPGAFVMGQEGIQVLEGRQVPAGALEQAEPVLLSRKLWDGDRLIMVTCVPSIGTRS